MNPYVTERLAEGHRDDLLRAAEASRLAHASKRKARNRVQWGRTLLRFRTSTQRAGAKRLGSGQVRELGRG